MKAEISGGVNARLAETDPHDAGRIGADRERKQPRIVPDVVDALAHEALDGIDGARGFGRQPPLRFAAHVDRAVGRGRNNRRHEAIAAPVADDDRHAVLHVGDEAVGRPEIDPYDFAHDSRMVNAEPDPSPRGLEYSRTGRHRLGDVGARGDSPDRLKPTRAVYVYVNSRSMPARRLLM